ncbi:hypothetical protein [Aureibacillus halotolerans]|uniref:Uncharacterized protein n=1 Tax=Aureibacillus halotolerans TaxID=1508390 RepID=A0A4R6U0M3_9BACI|nr:hypothetical protein [Aureibacillus halotolerans]TDQ39216.1 hypothetical protein EV213_108168 [Aureibacillus halotolerans]
MTIEETFKQLTRVAYEDADDLQLRKPFSISELHRMRILASALNRACADEIGERIEEGGEQ